MKNDAVKAYHKRRYQRLLSRLDADDDEGRWITTENGHKVHLNEEGEPDKGNPHVTAVMSGSSPKVGTKYKNKNGVVIEVTNPTKDGHIQYKVGDEVHITTPESFPNILSKNGYEEVKSTMKGEGSLKPSGGSAKSFRGRTTKDSVKKLHEIDDQFGGWTGNREDFIEAFKDEGFEVLADYDESIVLEDTQNDSDTQYVVEFGGSRSTVTIEDIRAEKMPDSDDDYEPTVYDDDINGVDSAMSMNGALFSSPDALYSTIQDADGGRYDILNYHDNDCYSGDILYTDANSSDGVAFLAEWQRNYNASKKDAIEIISFQELQDGEW